MIPLRDSNPSGTAPVVTVALIALNVVVWFYEVALGPRVERFIFDYGLIPARFVASLHHPVSMVSNALVPLFTSVFMHGGWLHVIGNMWFLWIFGDNVEDRLGHFRFLIFYLMCGIGASIAHVMFHPGSNIPTIGASGAISGVLGAYLVSFPHSRVLTLLIIFVIIRLVEIPAFLFLILWFVFQFVSGTAEIGSSQETGGVAYWAHMGGFVIGIALLWFFPKRRRFREYSAWAD
ncbi:MAG: rhomboid family intramembrane serine protease [Deltaproteobacteria bacterium]|nr:rhomboid family intramembrane serine protease [Deltaproteobacteria bacterium]